MQYKALQCNEHLSENLHSEMQLNELDSPRNFLTMYDMSDNINEHGFASHLGYTPTYRFSTLTFICVLISECGLRKNIRCALDTMSNVTLLRRSIADELYLRGPKCDLQLGVTGGQVITFKKQRKVNFRLGSIQNSYVSDFIIEAATIPIISQGFERILVDPSEYDYLHGLEWTEPLPMSEDYYEANKSVDLLLGVPYETLIREPPYLILGPLGDPNAFLTKLGNCLSVNSGVQNKQFTYFCKNCEVIFESALEGLEHYLTHAISLEGTRAQTHWEASIYESLKEIRFEVLKFLLFGRKEKEGNSTELFNLLD